MKGNATSFFCFFSLEFFSANLGKFGQKSFAPSKICMLLHLCHIQILVEKYLLYDCSLCQPAAVLSEKRFIYILNCMPNKNISSFPSFICGRYAQSGSFNTQSAYCRNRKTHIPHQNRRQKVFNRGTLPFCGEGGLTLKINKNSTDL